jgi:hypothetical protein
MFGCAAGAKADAELIDYDIDDVISQSESTAK